MNLRRWLPRVFFESFLIVLSILAALAVNDWRETHERRQRIADARQAFANEISANRDLAGQKDYLPYHRHLQSTYNKVRNENGIDPGTIFELGVHPTPLRDAAWRSFSSSGIMADFAPADVLILSDIYRAQEALERMNSGFISALTAPRADRDSPSYARDETRAVSMFLNDVVPAEEHLLKLYAKALEQLTPSAPQGPK